MILQLGLQHQTFSVVYSLHLNKSTFMFNESKSEKLIKQLEPSQTYRHAVRGWVGLVTGDSLLTPPQAEPTHGQELFVKLSHGPVLLLIHMLV